DDATTTGRIERIYHLLCGNPDVGCCELQALDRMWLESGRLEYRYALATVLEELVDTDLVHGRELAWCLLIIGRVRDSRGEGAQSLELAEQALDLARSAGDEVAEADARYLTGSAGAARGSLAAAKLAFDQEQVIRRQLAAQDPGNADLQQDLAAAL